MRFLDTNILLRYFTKDDEKKANDVLRLLKKVEKGISFADAFNFCFMEKNGVKEIYSFDEEFDKLKNIKRIIP